MYNDVPGLSTIATVWVIGAIVVALIARSRGVPATFYVILSLLLSPVVGVILALIATPANRAPCWRCKEMVIRGAMVCPRCQAELTWPEAAPAP